jgi:lactoylglutathione lyase
MQKCPGLPTNNKMKIEHLAIWVDDLERMKAFYLKYFEMNAGEKYTNSIKKYESYFLFFGEAGTMIELMQKPGISSNSGERGLQKGLAHFAISVGTIKKVNSLTELFRKDHYTIYSEPRTTGDGYFESVVLDPEGNFIELTI